MVSAWIKMVSDLPRKLSAARSSAGQPGSIFCWALTEIAAAHGASRPFEHYVDFHIWTLAAAWKLSRYSSSPRKKFRRSAFLSSYPRLNLGTAVQRILSHLEGAAGCVD